VNRRLTLWLHSRDKWVRLLAGRPGFQDSIPGRGQRFLFTPKRPEREVGPLIEVKYGRSLLSKFTTFLLLYHTTTVGVYSYVTD
jgi:hypothetical protein